MANGGVATVLVGGELTELHKYTNLTPYTGRSFAITE
jgi:hypothetical protein